MGKRGLQKAAFPFKTLLVTRFWTSHGLVVNTSIVSVEGRGLGEKCGGNPGKMVASLAQEEGGHTLLSPSVSQKEVTTSPWEAEAELNISL